MRTPAARGQTSHGIHLRAQRNRRAAGLLASAALGVGVLTAPLDAQITLGMRAGATQSTLRVTDATNVVETPAISVITPISIDHTQFLGDDLAGIAAEKAGILKEDVTAVIGPQNEVAMEAMRIHGGYGYIKEYPVERYYRDAPLMIIGEGTNEIQKLVIARRLLDKYGA